MALYPLIDAKGVFFGPMVRFGCGLLLVLSCLCGDALAANGLWLCPGNFFTNEIGAREAKAQSCTPVLPSLLSQAHGGAPLATGPAGSAMGEKDQAGSSFKATATTSPGGARSVPGGNGKSQDQLRTDERSRVTQQRRDEDARAILKAELERTQAQIVDLSVQTDGAQKTAALQRLRSDEAALLRELGRLSR